MSEFLSAIRKGRKPSLQNPCGEPSFCRLEALESLNCFQSSVELLVVALNEVCCFRTAIVKKILRFHISCQQIAVVKDMLECSDLQRVVVVSWRSPADVTFQIRLTEVRKIEDLCLKIFKERSVCLFTAYLQGFSDVLEEMHMAKLHNNAGVDSFCRHADGFIVIADEGEQFIAGVLELYEKLEEGLIILTGCQHADWNVMRQVIDAVDEGDFSVIAFHCDKLSIDDEEAAESLGVAVAEGDLIVVRQGIQLFYNASVSAVRSFADVSCQRADAGTFEMRQQQRVFRNAVINAETLAAILAAVPFQSSPMSVPFGVE